MCPCSSASSAKYFHMWLGARSRSFHWVHPNTHGPLKRPTLPLTWDYVDVNNQFEHVVAMLLFAGPAETGQSRWNPGCCLWGDVGQLHQADGQEKKSTLSFLNMMLRVEIPFFLEVTNDNVCLSVQTPNSAFALPGWRRQAAERPESLPDSS